MAHKLAHPSIWFQVNSVKLQMNSRTDPSVCIVGGHPVLLRAEPTKQKTRRPERRGITRAVSPKKIGKRKNGNVPGSETSGGKSERAGPSGRFGVPDGSGVGVADDESGHRPGRLLPHGPNPPLQHARKS
jgi:hypothetical protein